MNVRRSDRNSVIEHFAFIFFFSSFPVNFPTAKYPPLAST